MRGITHFLAGAAAGLYYCNTLPETDVKTLGIVAGVSAAAALLPDIDIRGSKASNNVGNDLVSVVRLFTAHRGFFHSPLCWAIVAAVVWYFWPQYLTFIIAGLIGALSHVVLDMFNKKGVPLFFPYPKKVSIMDIKSGGGVDAMLSAVFLVLAIYFAGKKAGLLELLINR
ncbi:MAG: metal-dependent hydrolase [Firmicutes bacterium]|nr:metal-dependent hydrolase [Bacillota bacterium]